MNLWRTIEFRGSDPYDNPFVDFGFVKLEGERLALSSHMLREPLWVDGEQQVMATFKCYYQAQGCSKLRYKILWQEGVPIDTPFAEGWEDM